MLTVTAKGFALLKTAREMGDAIRQSVQEQVRVAREQAEAARAEGKSGPVIVIPGVTPFPGAPAAPALPSQTGQGFPFDGYARTRPRGADVSIAFIVIIGLIVLSWPIMRALARRIDRPVAAPQIPAGLSAQLNQLSQSVDAIALEVERISEGQRFTTRLLSEQRPEAPKIEAQGTILGPAAKERV